VWKGGGGSRVDRKLEGKLYGVDWKVVESFRGESEGVVRGKLQERSR
jgi:hypothetical protein